MSPQGVKKIFAYLLDMAYQKVDGHLRVLQSDSKVELIPRLPNLEILKLPFSLLKQVPAEQGAFFLELLCTTFHREDNLTSFEQAFGMEPIFNTLKLVENS